MYFVNSLLPLYAKADYLLDVSNLTGWVICDSIYVLTTYSYYLVGVERIPNCHRPGSG